MKRDDDERVSRTIEAWRESEQRYDEFLSDRGLDRSDIRRAALGAGEAGPARRKIIDRAIAWFESELDPDPEPAAAGEAGRTESRVPPHAIRI